MKWCRINQIILAVLLILFSFVLSTGNYVHKLNNWWLVGGGIVASVLVIILTAHFQANWISLLHTVVEVFTMLCLLSILAIYYEISVFHLGIVAGIGILASLFVSIITQPKWVVISKYILTVLSIIVMFCLVAYVDHGYILPAISLIFVLLTSISCDVVEIAPQGDQLMLIVCTGLISIIILAIVVLLITVTGGEGLDIFSGIADGASGVDTGGKSKAKIKI